MNPHTKITETYGAPPFHDDASREERAAAVRATIAEARSASVDASEREMAFLRALNRTADMSHSSALQLKSPRLTDDFSQRVAALDDDIFARGVAVDRQKLVTVGKQGFEQLLEADHVARSEQRVIGSLADLTSFASVYHAFALAGALQVSSVPQRPMKEIAAGAGKDRAAVSLIESFDDLWKSTSEPRTVRAIYRFRDLFEPLAFCHSILERLDNNDRVRSRFFCGGSGRKVALLSELLAVLKQPLTVVRLPTLTWHVVAWLAGEHAQPPVVLDLARDFFNVRAPDAEQLRFMQAALEGFVRAYDGWALWQFVGRQTRSVTPIAEQLTDLRRALARRYPRIAQFHNELKNAFYRSVGQSAIDAHQQFDAAAYRSFVDTTIHNLSTVVSAIAALTIDEKVPVVARFDDLLIFEGKAQNFLQSRLESELATAFAQANFETSISEVQP
jgi:hypothetical protein